MKTYTHLLSIGILFFALVALGFAVPAHAAMAPQSRLVSMQTDGADVNYDPLVMTTGAPQSQSLSWPSFREFMITVSEMIIGVAVFFLVYLAAVAFGAYSHNHKKGRVRIHSHSLAARHRHG